jgi:hypothetical protein
LPALKALNSKAQGEGCEAAETLGFAIPRFQRYIFAYINSIVTGH